MSTNKHKILRKYFLIGFIFGLMFPVGAILFQMLLTGKFGFIGIIDAHFDNPLIYMIDSAPIFLGAFALIGGINQAKSEAYAIELLEAKSKIESSIESREIIYKKNEQMLTKTSNLSDELYNNLNLIENSMKELFDNENFIKIKSDEVSHSIDHIVNLANQIADKTKLEVTSVEKTLISTEIISSNIQGTSSQLKLSMKTFENDVNKINTLGQEVHDVIAIIKDIHNISSDIKLLSLNASIEASRAGEQGKGFAVVADEIRLLSDSSSSATDKIEKLSNSINLKTQSLKTDISSLQIDLNAKINEISEASAEVLNIIDKLHMQKKSSFEVYELTSDQEKKLSNMHTYINDINNSIIDMSNMLTTCQSSISKNEAKVIELKSIEF